MTIAANNVSGVYNGSASNLIPWSHVLGSGSNRLVMVSVSIGNGSGAYSIASATFNGVAMIDVTGQLIHGGTSGRVFRLGQTSLPSSGTYPIVVQLAGGTFIEGAGTAVDYTGVFQSPPVVQGNNGTGSSGASAALTLTDAANLLVASTHVKESATVASPFTNNTQYGNAGNAMTRQATADGTGGTVTATISGLSGSFHSIISVVEIAAATGGGGGGGAEGAAAYYYRNLMRR